MIEVQGLSKKFGRKTVVDQLSFVVNPGVVTGFLGPNGSGKSTTMRMIVGLDKPSAGKSTIDGLAYKKLKKPMHKVGALLDASWIHNNRSAKSHLKWMAAANGIPRKRVDEVLEYVGLASVAREKAGGYSLGMRQRLGLASTLLGDPDVLIFDEPSNGLDPEGILWIRQFMQALADEGKTVFVSSHLLSEMALTADELVVIGRGKLLAQSTTQDFIAASTDQVITVRTTEPELLQEELLVEGIGSTVEEDGTLTVIVPPGVDDITTDLIGHLCFTLNLPLYELSAQHASLEDAFMKLTFDEVEYSAQREGSREEGSLL